MPITKTVNKTLVNGSESFSYTFNVSFSELGSPALSGKMVDFFPDKIIYALPPLGSQIISIDEIPVPGGTQVEFNFGAVNAGTSINFEVGCSFGPGRVDNDSFTNTAELFADDTSLHTVTADTVNLELDELFDIRKLPVGGTVNPGEEITFTLSIRNTAGDPGAEITNVVLQDVLPPQLIPVLSFTPVGNDTSGASYNDTTYDGLNGTWTGNTLDFTLPSFNGLSYTIEYKATVAPDVVPGETFSNSVNWSVEGVDRPGQSRLFTVFEDKAEVSLNKFAPPSGTVGDTIQYNVYTYNNGTVDLDNYTITDTPPPEVDITEISFESGYSFDPSDAIYSMYVETSELPGTYKTVALNISGYSGPYDLTPFIPTGERVLSVRVIIQTVEPPAPSITPYRLYLSGTVNNTALPDQTIINTANVTATSALGDIDQQTTDSTVLDGRSTLNISKSISPVQPAYFPLSEFTISQTARASSGSVVEPIFADLLPEGIDYAPGNDYFLYYDVISNTTYDSREPGFPIPLPTAEVIKDYQGTGRTLVRFEFTGFTLPYSNTLTAAFSALVTLNPPDEFENYSYLGNPGDNADVVGTPYLDDLDLDGDGITDEEIAQSNLIGGLILTTSEFSIEKWVKGNLENDFTKDSTVTPGGDIVYKLNLTNNQEIDLTNIELVDILPHVGDTGVILNTTPRGSQFPVYLTSVATAEIINVLGDPVIPPPIIYIEYSTSYDPIRFDENGTGTIGTGTWSATPPADLSTIASIKITVDPSIILKPYERLVITLNAIAPVDTPVNQRAYNSFALRADKIVGDGTEPLLPVEPNKVSVRTVLPNLASIGDFVWDDLNGDGFYDADEPGINGVVVELYDSNQMLIESVVTSNNLANEPGYYVFNNLVEGDYYVKFIPPTDRELTIQQTGATNGSKPDPLTGFTNIISLGVDEVITDVDAGIVPAGCQEPPEINAEDIIVCTGVEFDPLANVTATDCDGVDIPLTNDNVISNTVDTSTPGDYVVSYEVTSPTNELTTTKTISVTVEHCIDIQKSLNPSQAIVGDIVEFTILVTNTNPFIDYTDVVINDPIFNNFKFVDDSVTVDGISKPGINPGIGIPVGDLNIGQTKTVKFKVEVVDDVDNSASNIAYGQFLYNGSLYGFGTSNEIQLEVLKANLEITKSVLAFGDPLYLGDTATYTVNIVNTGNMDAENVIFKDFLPSGVKLNPNQVTISSDNTTLVINNPDFESGIYLGSLSPTQIRQLIYTVEVTGGTCSGKLINEAYAIADYEFEDGRRETKETEHVSTTLNVGLTSFSQLVTSSVCTLPCQKPNIEEINNVEINAEIISSYVAKTYKGVSNEGNTLSGYKLIINGIFKIMIEYTADLESQPIHNYHCNIPFGNFVILPEDYEMDSKINININIEDIDAHIINNRDVDVSIVYLLSANICY